MKASLLNLFLFFAANPVIYAQQEPSSGISIPEREGPREIAGHVHQLVPPADLEATRTYENEHVIIHRFEREKWRSVVEGLNYDEDVREQEPEQSKENISWSGETWDGPLWRLVAYVVVIGAVTAGLYFLLKNISFDLNIRKPPLASASGEDPLENIESLDTRALLNRAIEDKNYKLAVRLYYLALLKALNENGIIAWKKDKTNKEYLAELFSRGFLFDEITKLTRSYESVWYGDHDLRREAFNTICQHFEAALERVNGKESK